MDPMVFQTCCFEESRVILSTLLFLWWLMVSQVISPLSLNHDTTQCLPITPSTTASEWLLDKHFENITHIPQHRVSETHDNIQKSQCFWASFPTNQDIPNTYRSHIKVFLKYIPWYNWWNYQDTKLQLLDMARKALQNKNDECRIWSPTWMNNNFRVWNTDTCMVASVLVYPKLSELSKILQGKSNILANFDDWLVLWTPESNLKSKCNTLLP